MDARADRRGAADTLEVERDKVEQTEVSCSNAEVDGGTKANCALLVDAERDDGFVAKIPLLEDEGASDEDEANNQTDDLAIAPFVPDTAPLQREQEADNGAQ